MTVQENNSPRRADVERVVREVLANLLAQPNGAPRSVAANELVLHSRVVSLNQIEGRLQGIARLVMPRGAIVTPAAKDELKKHGVAVASIVAPPKTNGQPKLVIAATGNNLATLVTALTNDGVQTELLPPADTLKLTDDVCAKLLAGSALGLLLTDSPAAALCLANRQPGVRAALAWNVAAVAEATTAVAANLLVIDPRGKSAFELRQMARELVRSGGRECPSPWRERLG